MEVKSYEVHYTMVFNDVETEIRTIVTLDKPVKNHEDIYNEAERQLNEMFDISIRRLREAHDYSIHPV